MSSYEHLYPRDVAPAGTNQIEDVGSQTVSPEFGSFLATQGSIFFNSAAARAIAEPDDFDADVNQRLADRYSQMWNEYKQIFDPTYKSEVGPGSRFLARATNALARTFGYNDSDMIFALGEGRKVGEGILPSWMPNGEDLYQVMNKPMPPTEWNDDEKEVWYIIKNDPELMEMVDKLSPVQKERRLNNLRYIKQVGEENVARNYAESQGFFSNAAEFGAQAGAYIATDPLTTASILYPVARFRMAQQGAVGRTAIGQGLRDATPFAISFPVVGKIEEQRLIDLGAEKDESQQAFFDRLLEVPAAFALRGLGSILIDAAPIGARGAARAAQNIQSRREQKARNAAGVADDTQTTPPADVGKDVDYNAAKQKDSNAKAVDEHAEIIKIKVKVAANKPFSQEERKLVVDTINENIPKREDRIVESDLFDEKGVVKKQNLNEAIAGTTFGEPVEPRTPLEKQAFDESKGKLDRSPFLENLISAILRGQDIAEEQKPFIAGTADALRKGGESTKLRNLAKIQSLHNEIQQELDLAAQTGSEITQERVAQVKEQVKEVVDERVADIIKDADSLNSTEFVNALNAGAAVAKKREAGLTTPESTFDNEVSTSFDATESQRKATLVQHTEQVAKKAVIRQGEGELSPEEQTQLNNVISELEEVENELFAARREVEKEFNEKLKSLDANQKEKLGKIDPDDVDRRREFIKKWRKSIDDLRQKYNNKQIKTAEKYEPKIAELERKRADLGENELSFWSLLRMIRESDITGPVKKKETRKGKRGYVAVKGKGKALDVKNETPTDFKLTQRQRSVEDKAADDAIDEKFNNANAEDITTLKRRGIYDPDGKNIVADVDFKVEILSAGTPTSPRHYIRVTTTDSHGTINKYNMNIGGDVQVAIREEDVAITRNSIVTDFNPPTAKVNERNKPFLGQPVLKTDLIRILADTQDVTYEQRFYSGEAAVREADFLKGSKGGGITKNEVNIADGIAPKPGYASLSENWIMNNISSFEGDAELRRLRQEYEVIWKCVRR